MFKYAVMMANGADVKIGKVLIGKFGTQSAVYRLGLFVGIASWPFLSTILAFWPPWWAC